MPFPDLVLATTPEDLRMDFGHGSTFLTLHSRHTITSSPPATLNPPIFPASVQASSAAESGSRTSSPPLQSPGTIEDLDRYRNLFYYPKMSGSPMSDEQRRTFSRDSASLGSVSGGSGLATLARQLSNEFGVTGGGGGGPSRMWWLQHHHGQRGGGPKSSNSDYSDTEAALLPLSMPQPSEGSFTVRIPQDVESHRSSVLERSEMDDGTSGWRTPADFGKLIRSN
jgi:hypothetical protein